MATRRYLQPQQWLSELQQDFNRFFDKNYGIAPSRDDSEVATGAWNPSVDIQELPNAFKIHADLPGVQSKDIEVYMENGTLTLRGRRESEHKEETSEFVRVERSQGEFYRRFSLPETADSGNIQAKIKDGVLEVVIPKHEKSVSRRIEVKKGD